ncbi:DUF4345 domain-containing protein [Parasphingorhabdus sp.]|uniref:DUF4345 domain-containing protein n=1 Tax=Parasphingorhabdus sp. TaxID=2709688 RepID=UPI002F9548E9
MKLFRIAIIIFAFIPLYFGITGTISGAAQLAGGEPAASAVDNQFRYLSGIYIGLAIMLFYAAGDVIARGQIFRLAMLAVFIGGLGRLVSYLTIGGAELWQTGGMVTELLAPPLFLIWQAYVLRRSSNIIR